MVKALTTAMIGLRKSASVITVARHRSGPPAMLRPWWRSSRAMAGIMAPRVEFGIEHDAFLSRGFVPAADETAGWSQRLTATAACSWE